MLIWLNHAVYNDPTLSDMSKYAAYDGLGQWERWVKEHPVTT